MVCTETCWTPVQCPEHGDVMDPCNAGESAAYCCSRRFDTRFNHRHLWDEHDPARKHTDPEGWAEHQEQCTTCPPHPDRLGVTP